MAETYQAGAAVPPSAQGAKKSRIEMWIEQADQRWKPPGFAAEMEMRWHYYHGNQEPYLLVALVKAFPNSWQEMALHTSRLTQRIVKTRSQVFGRGCSFPLVSDDGETLAGDSPDVERWSEVLRRANVKAHLRTADRWAQLMNTSFVKVGWDERIKAPALCVYAPHFVAADLDPLWPLDLDKATGITLETASAKGAYVRDIRDKRFEFWSAVVPARGYLTGHYVVDGTDEVVDVPGIDGTNPYADEEERPIVPVVAFRSMEPELGLFCDANRDLVRANLALNVTKTDTHYIARCQGFGQPYAEQDATSPAPATLPKDVVLGPARMPYFPRGVTIHSLQLSPQLDALRELMAWDAKDAAVSWDVPAGAVLADSRTVASAEALVVEREPLLEAREEQAEAYRESVERLFKVIRIVNNFHAEAGDRISDGVTLAWQPGGGRVPFSPKEEQDVDVADLRNDLTTASRILAKRHGVTLDDARAMLEDIRKENREAGAERIRQQQQLFAGQHPRLAAVGAPPEQKIPPEKGAPPAEGEEA